MIKINCVGDICPMPVIKAKNELEKISSGGITVIVDNKIAAENLEKLAKEKGCEYEAAKDSDGNYYVILHKDKNSEDELRPPPLSLPSGLSSVVVISSDKMGDGDEKLGQTLIKGFIYALSESNEVPDAIVFYNSGAHITAGSQESLEDLKKLEQKGVLILTCGACIDFYGYKKPHVGGITNMYEIVEKFLAAGRIIRP